MRIIYKFLLYIKQKMSPKEKDFDSIIELLKKNYSLKTEKNLRQKVGEIVQDHINRGLYNCTVCISKQLQAHYDYIDDLIDCIVESLKKDFANISLEQCKEKILAIVDEEYKKLVPFTNAFLVRTSLASQSNLKNFEQGINNEKEKAKQAVETKIALTEKSEIKKRYRGFKVFFLELYEKTVKAFFDSCFGK